MHTLCRPPVLLSRRLLPETVALHPLLETVLCAGRLLSEAVTVRALPVAGLLPR
jgi:hypothetical protein